ncbi:MAG: hypothetical protein AB4038_03365 [Prochloraceae cyanobacterium]
MGHQNPWHDGLNLMLQEIIPLYLDAEFFDLVKRGPQMWAIHSAKLAESYIGILSVSLFHIESGDYETQFLALNYKKEEAPSERLLAEIAYDLEQQISAHLEEVFTEVANILDGAKPTIPMTTTHIAIENIRRSLSDRWVEDN